MPNKRSGDKQAVTVYVPRELRAAATAKAAAEGDTITAVVERALEVYVERVTTPPDPAEH